VEQIPYAQAFMPPYPFPGSPFSPDGGGGSGSGGSGDGTASTTQNPMAYDLAWTAGDWFEAEFFFDNVAWTPEDPFTADIDRLADMTPAFTIVGGRAMFDPDGRLSPRP